MKTIEFEKTSVADARRAIDGEPKPSVERLGYPRAGEANEVLLDTTLTWMASHGAGSTLSADC